MEEEPTTKPEKRNSSRALLHFQWITFPSTSWRKSRPSTCQPHTKKILARFTDPYLPSSHLKGWGVPPTMMTPVLASALSPSCLLRNTFKPITSSVFSTPASFLAFSHSLLKGSRFSLNKKALSQCHIFFSSLISTQNTQKFSLPSQLSYLFNETYLLSLLYWKHSYQVQVHEWLPSFKRQRSFCNHCLIKCLLHLPQFSIHFLEFSMSLVSMTLKLLWFSSRPSDGIFSVFLPGLLSSICHLNVDVPQGFGCASSCLASACSCLFSKFQISSCICELHNTSQQLLLFSD